jgi:hypothetical protein
MIKIKQGDKYGLLTIQSEAPRYNHKKITYPRRLMNVTCDCRPNREIVVRLDHLRQGATKSCGCLKSKQKKYENRYYSFLHLKRTPDDELNESKIDYYLAIALVLFWFYLAN